MGFNNFFFFNRILCHNEKNTFYTFIYNEFKNILLDFFCFSLEKHVSNYFPTNASIEKKSIQKKSDGLF